MAENRRTHDPIVSPSPADWNFPMMRWEELMPLYLRAIAEKVKLRDDPEYPELFALATSGTQEGVEYRVNEFLCACQAGQHGMNCKHRALFLVKHIRRLGRVIYTDDEAAAWVSPATTPDAEDTVS